MPSRLTISLLVVYGALIWFLVLLFEGVSVAGFFEPITIVIGASGSAQPSSLAVPPPSATSST